MWDVGSGGERIFWFRMRQKRLGRKRRRLAWRDSGSRRQKGLMKEMTVKRGGGSGGRQGVNEGDKKENTSEVSHYTHTQSL